MDPEAAQRASPEIQIILIETRPFSQNKNDIQQVYNSWSD